MASNSKNSDNRAGSLQAVLKRIDNTLLNIELDQCISRKVLPLLTQIADSLDQISLNLSSPIDELKEAIKANTQKLDDIYTVLTEILEQSHNPLRPLPPLPVGKGGNHHDYIEERGDGGAKPSKRQHKLDKIDREGFGKWK